MYKIIISYMHIRTEFELPLNKDNLKKALGSRLGRSLERPKIKEQFEYICAKLPSLIEPKVGWKKFAVKCIQDGQFLLKNGIKIGDGPMMEVLKESKNVVIYLATLGEGVDKELNELNAQKKLMASVILDSLGSFLIGQVLHQFEIEYKLDYSDNGGFHNISFAPGDTDWPLEDQDIIFDLLDPEKIGMRLTEVRLMVPQKSLSGLFGLSDIKFELDHFKRCDFCPRKNTCRIYTVGGI